MARRGGTACKRCGAPIVLFRSASRGTWRPFEPRPEDPRNVHPLAVPIESGRWWRLDVLVAELAVRRRCSTAEAELEARDLPWHRPHPQTCTTTALTQQEA